MEIVVTILQRKIATLLSMLVALGMACKDSKPPAAQEQANPVSVASGEEPAATRTEGAAAAGEGNGASSPALVEQSDETPRSPAAVERLDIARFQALFAPIWGTKPDAERAGRACEAADELKTRVEAIDKRLPPPGADDKAWLSAVERLQDYIGEIGVYCEDGEDVDTDGILELIAHAHEWLETVTKMLPR